ncbi:MAG: hypothetical protein HY584_04770 [Candidatus Omnitrophica bacterium]|nr:hypothetical protein [Candidatus Omnitrophota bacterium]
MKYLLTAIFVVMLVFSNASVKFSYAAEASDTAIDQVGDWLATVGKQGVEKDQIIAQRKAERAARRAEEEAKKAAKEAEHAGEDMQKKMGF